MNLLSLLWDVWLYVWILNIYIMYLILFIKFEGNLVIGLFSMFFFEISFLKIVYKFYKCLLFCFFIIERIRKMIFFNFGSILDEM